MSIQDIVIKIKGVVGEENLCKIRLILPFLLIAIVISGLLATSFVFGMIHGQRSNRQKTPPVSIELPPYLAAYEIPYNGGVLTSLVDSKPQSQPGSIHNPKTKAPEPIIPPKPHSTHSFIVSKTGKVYYPSDCSSVNRIKPENRVYYDSLSELIARGYTPSKTCIPK